MRELVRDALLCDELRNSLVNVIGVDDKKAPEEYSNEEIIKEAEYLLTCYFEPGHSNNEMFRGDDGLASQRTAKREVRQLKKFLNNYRKLKKLDGHALV